MLVKLAVGFLLFPIVISAPIHDNVDLDSTSDLLTRNGYIVVLRDDAQSLDSHISWAEGVHKRNLAKRGQGERQDSGIDWTYNGANHFIGYTGHFDDATIKEIRNSPDVHHVEEDQPWYLDEDSNISQLDEGEEEQIYTPSKLTSRTSFAKDKLKVQNDSTWGLASITHRQPGHDSFLYHDDAGKDMYAYVLDSGIRTSHDEFEGRAESVWTAFEGQNQDSGGHGTHVAGTIGGKTYGVAKRAKLLGIKIFHDEKNTSTSTIIKALSWSIDDIVEKKRVGKAVVNMSLGGGVSDTMNKIIASAAEKGIITVVAAGNNGEDVKTKSPASAPKAITVAGVDSEWKMYDNSNWGEGVDIFAPAVEVKSAGHEKDDQWAVMTGTSMACPHVSGLVLTAMSVDGVHGLDNIVKHLVDRSTKDALKGSLKGSVNRMANNGNWRQ